MKKYFVRVIALLISAALTLPSAALAVRFQDRGHFTPTGSDMTYERPTNEAEYNALAAEIVSLSASGSNSAELLRRWDELDEIYNQWWLKYVLAAVNTYRDVYDTAAAEEYSYMDTLTSNADETRRQTVVAVLDSPCAAALRDRLGEDVCAAYAAAAPLTDEQIKLQEQINALVSRYYSRSGETYSTTTAVGGKTRTAAELETLYSNGSIDYAQYLALYGEIDANMNAAVTDLYMQLVALRTRYAATAGYDSYMDYAYYNDFGREYTPDDAAGFFTAVKTELVPLYGKLERLYPSSEWYGFYYGEEYSIDDTLSLIETYLPKISPELGEGLDYMLKNELYDFDLEGARANTSVTFSLPESSAFMFSTPTGTPYDLTTLVHELGHYNYNYWTGEDAAMGYSYDIMEIHSQALELLFMEYYDDIYGAEAGEAGELYELYSILGSVIYGAFIGEAEIYAHENPNITGDEFNRAVGAIAETYGLATAGDGRYYNWANIPHMFENPGYYISYGVSSAAAAEIWSNYRSSAAKGVEQYLSVLEQQAYSLTDVLDSAGLSSPFSETTLAAVGGAIEDACDIMTDTYGHFAEGSIDTLTREGVLNGYEENGEWLFKPYNSVTRAEFVKMLYMLADGEDLDALPEARFTDVKESDWFAPYVGWAVRSGIASGTSQTAFSPNATLTRQDMSVMFCNFCEAWGLDISEYYSPAPAADFTDEAAIAGYASAAVDSLTRAGVLSGDPSGSFRPTATTARGEAAKVLGWMLAA